MIKYLAILFSVFALCLSAQAVTVTNADGTVFTVNTTEGDAIANADLTVREDQSTYAHQTGHRLGLIVRDYSFALDGGAVGTIELGDLAIPENSLVYDGYIQVLTAVNPATATNALHIMAAGDVLATGTSLNSTGIKDVVPANAAANAVLVTTSTNKLALVVSGSAITSGVFRIFLPYVQVQ